MNNKTKCAVKRLLVFFVVFTMIYGSIFPAYAAWDGYVEPAGEKGGANTTVILDMNILSNITSTVATPSESVRGNAAYTAKWANHKTFGSLTFPNVPRDWSSFEKVDIPIYSENATRAKITFVLYCDYESSPTAQTSYWYYSFYVDWTGWKVITVSFTENLNQYNKANIKKVTRITFSASGWSGVPNENTVLYFDSMIAHLQDEDAGIIGSKYTKEQKNRFVKETNGGLVLYNYSPNVFVNGMAKEIDPENSKSQVLPQEGYAMAPTALFANHLGASVVLGGNSATIERDGKTLKATAGQKDYTVNGEEKSFATVPFVREGVLYVPVVETAEAFGLQGKTSDMLTILGGESQIRALSDDPMISEVGGFMVSNRTIDPTTITQEDFTAVKENWRRYLVGDENNDMSNSVVKQVVDKVVTNAQASWNMMNKGDDVVVLFGKNPVTTTNDMGLQYGYLNRMAKGYGTPGSSLYKNLQLKQDLLYGLEWLYNNLYGQDEINGTGWRDTSLFNWWDWYVHVPNNLTEALFILEPEISQDLIDKYLSPFDYFRANMRTTKNLTMAQSRLYVVTAAAALEQDAALMQECMYDFDLVLQKTDQGDGVYDDYTYINHGYYHYVGMYGTGVLLERLVKTASILAGTKFEITSAQKYNQALWMYNTFEPFIYNGSMMSMVNGRAPANGLVYGRVTIQAALDLLGCFGEEDDLKLKTFIHRNVNQDNLNSVISALTVNQAVKLLKVLDEKLDVVPDKSARVYYNGDRVVQHRDGYSVGIAMSSSRRANYECINDVNKSAWYTGDGMLYVYTGTNWDKDEYGTTFWNNVNYYHMPGTTEDTQTREALSISEHYLPAPNFVGGVSYEDKFAVAAMDFEAYRNETQSTSTNSSGYGGGLPYHKNDLVAKKSWFLFDNELVAVGSGINSTQNTEVRTIVENRLLEKIQKPIIQTNADSPVEYPVINVTASGSDGNVPGNTIDNNYDTRWSLQGTKDVTLTLELKEAVPVGYAAISQYGGVGGNQAIFDLEASMDGKTWETIYSGMASGTTEWLETYDMKGTIAKFIRYNGKGRTKSQWNSITEFEIYPPRSDGRMLLADEGGDGTIYGVEDIVIDGNLLEKANLIQKENIIPNWVHLENFGGYFFPTSTNVSLKKTDSKSSFLEMWINHGTNPKNAGYAYVLLPKQTSAETEVYAKDPDVEILSATNEIHAVRDKSTGLTGVIFWKAGTFDGITVSAPMALLYKKIENGYKLSVSDPSQKTEKASIIFDETLTICEGDSNVSFGDSVIQKMMKSMCNKTLTVVEAGKENQTVISVDFSKNPGKTMTTILKK